METEIILIVVSLFFSAFFSGVEMAFVTANKLKLELLKSQGGVVGSIIAGFVNNPSRFLGMTLLGNNIALIVLGMMASKLLEPGILRQLQIGFGYNYDYQALVLIIQTIITTILVLIFGEFIPKALFRINPEGVLQLLALPLKAMDFIFRVPVLFITWLSHLFLEKVLKVSTQHTTPVYNQVDLEDFIKQFVKKDQEEEEEDLNTDILERAMSLTEVRIRECMIPRTEIEAVEVNDTIEDLRNKFLETKHSKLIVYEEDIDHILGYVHHFDLLDNPESIHEIIFPIKVIPESMGARSLLNHFTKEHKSIAWVVDEFGGTAGIVTLEDILEEIFGEINDEHDSEDFIERQIADDEYIFSGRLEVDYVNDKYDLDIPEGDYETLSGFVVSNHEDIPDMDEVIIIGRYQIKIITVSDTRINTVKIKVLKNDA
ncbi:hemolysin family protein [soil metagenome]